MVHNEKFEGDKLNDNWNKNPIHFQQDAVVGIIYRSYLRHTSEAMNETIISQEVA